LARLASKATALRAQRRSFVSGWGGRLVHYARGVDGEILNALMDKECLGLALEQHRNRRAASGKNA
jgi:hypothetical protein